MGGRLATYEDSGKVFLRSVISSVGGRSYAATQELGSSPLLPSSDFGRDSKLPRRRDFFNNRFFNGLFGDGFRPAREEV